MKDEICCPFCRTCDNDNLVPHVDYGKYQVRCLKCESRGPEVGDERSAMKKWFDLIEIITKNRRR